MGDVMTPARTLFTLAGSPPQDGCDAPTLGCPVCAQPCERSMPYARWQGATFTDQDKLRGHGLSNRICESCVWVHSWVVPPGHAPPEPGKKGVNLRLFWHAYDERGYVYGNKGSKPALRDWLRAPKVGAWWCAIADSGQKHVIPWTPVNHGASQTVRFEQRNLAIGEWSLVDAMTGALTAGVTKGEIESGMYTPRAWQLAESHVRALMSHSERGGGWWELALWLSQRDEAAVADRMAAEKETRDARRSEGGRSKGRGSSGDDGDAERVPARRGKRTQALGPATRPVPPRAADVEHGGADGDCAAPRPASLRAQLGLFGGSD